MKIRGQFLISTAIFSLVLVIVVTSVIVTNEQIAWLVHQQDISGNIERGADELNTLTSQYFLYQQPQQLTSWKANSAFILGNLSRLSPANSEQATLIEKATEDVGRLNTVFNELVLFLDSAPRNVSVRIIPEFQRDWNGTVTEHQTLGFDTSQLSGTLRSQSDQLRMTNIVLIAALLGIFGAFFVTIYFITYRRTLKSISNLQDGINIIGSGNLDYVIRADKNNEIGDLSTSFNQMTVNLKSVTASKKELEKEISERKKASDALIQSEKKYRRLYETSQDGIMARDIQGHMIDCNQAYARMLGYTKTELEQLPPQQLMPEKWLEQREKILKEVLEKGGSVVFEREYKRKDQTVFPASVRTWRIVDEEGKSIGTWSIVRDITEQKELQQKLRQHAKNLEELVEERTKQLKEAERMATIGQTAGMVGHDIRNPLQAIISDVYLLKSDLNSMPEGNAKKDVEESLKGIEKNVEYINKIVLDLQDYSRTIKPEIRKVNLEDLCEEILLKSNITENIRASCHVEKDAKTINSDPEVLKRILSNLVTNAVQAMPNGGKLELRVQKEPNDTIMAVLDTGEGIPEEVKPKLFTPLFTTKSKGQGFGLVVVKRMVEALGGTIAFESEQGKGTKFTVRLPEKEK